MTPVCYINLYLSHFEMFLAMTFQLHKYDFVCLFLNPDPYSNGQLIACIL